MVRRFVTLLCRAVWPHSNAPRSEDRLPHDGDPPNQLSALARLEQLSEENSSLRAQLADVGRELEGTRRQLRRLEQRTNWGEGSFAARYREREALIILPRLVELLPDEERFFIVDAGAREVDRDPRWKPFPQGRLKFVGFE